MPISRVRPLVRYAVAAALSLAACDRPRDGAGTRPRAEFLLSAGDSTYWVNSEAEGVRVRASSMLLARYGGRLYEIYAADDDRSFYDAIFTTQRIYRRDLVRGDSLPVFDDATVAALAQRYGASHPHESPLGPDDESADRPHTVASTEVSLVDVHGPYLTYESHADVEVDGGAARETVRRAVIDLRTARPAALADLFGAAAADSLVAAGRRALRRAVDSVRILADADEEASARALHALPTLRFLPDNFGLAVAGERPAVVFVSTGRDVDGHVVTLPLPPLPAPGALPAWWTRDVRETLPTTSRDSSDSRWRLGGAEVVARSSPSRETVALAVRSPGRARSREWPLGVVPAPARQLYALDRPPIDLASRRALARAFNESAMYGEDAVSAAYRPRRQPIGSRASSAQRRAHAARHSHPRS